MTSKTQPIQRTAVNKSITSIYKSYNLTTEFDTLTSILRAENKDVR